ncbi:hypothetical protein HK405_003842, partial [Cladochytrium tenue]
MQAQPGKKGPQEMAPPARRAADAPTPPLEDRRPVRPLHARSETPASSAPSRGDTPATATAVLRPTPHAPQSRPVDAAATNAATGATASSPLRRLLARAGGAASRLARPAVDSAAAAWRENLDFFRSAQLGTRDGLRAFVDSDRFHIIIITLVVLDMLAVFCDLLLTMLSSCLPIDPASGEFDPANGTCTATLDGSGPPVTVARSALFWVSLALLLVFCCEIATTVTVYGRAFWKSVLRVIDAFVVYASMGGWWLNFEAGVQISD